MKYMFKNKIAILLLIIGIMFIGCGYKTSNTQIQNKSFIKFNKSSTENFIVIINDKYKLKLESCVINKETGVCQDSTKNKVYEVKSGNTNIKVYNSDNQLILDKNIYIGSNDTIKVSL